MVDALDSKSSVPLERVGSSPTSGTNVFFLCKYRGWEFGGCFGGASLRHPWLREARIPGPPPSWLQALHTPQNIHQTPNPEPPQKKNPTVLNCEVGGRVAPLFFWRCGEGCWGMVCGRVEGAEPWMAEPPELEASWAWMPARPPRKPAPNTLPLRHKKIEGRLSSRPSLAHPSDRPGE